MGTTSDKLTYLNTTKGKIKDVINMTGANITSDTTFRNYATKLYDGYIGVLKDKNTLLDNMPKGTSTGTITDAADLSVYEDKMSKESTQETTTGKNKFDKDNVDWYRNNDSIFDDKINNSSTRIRTSSFEIEGGKTYKISGYPNTVSLLAIRTYNNEQSNLREVAFSNNVFTLNSDVSYIHLLFSGTNFTNETNELMKNANIQIEEGTTATSYESYTGGQASPNPDYPQEIKTVKGYRNLFNKDGNLSNGYLKVDGTVQNASGFKVSDYIDISNFSSITTSGNAGASEVYCFYDENKIFISAAGMGTDTTKTISVPTNAKYLRCTIKDNNLSQYQIVEGTEELPYVQYGTNWIYTAVSNGTDTNYYTIPLNGNEIVGKGINLDELIINKKGKCYLNKKFAKIDSYNGETITTDYWSTTGGLDTGATIYYVLATPQLIDLKYTVDLTLFVGVNNISNSEDMDMEIKYIKDTYE